MIPKNASLQQQLLLGDKAEKEAAFYTFIETEEINFTHLYSKKYGALSKQEAQDLWGKSTAFLFESFLWNDSIKETSNRKTQEITKIKRYLYFHFLQITKGISQPEEWNVMDTIFYIAENEYDKPLFLLADLLKKQIICQLFLGEKDLKWKIVADIFEQKEKVILANLRKYKTIIDEEKLKDVRNDAFHFVLEKLYPDAISNEKVKQLYFYITRRIVKNIEDCKDFNLDGFIFNVSKNFKEKRVEYENQYEKRYDIIEDEAYIQKKIEDKTPENNNVLELSEHQAIRKNILAELLEVKAQINALNTEKQGFYAFLSRISDALSFNDKAKKQELKLKQKELEEQQLLLMKNYLDMLKFVNLKPLIQIVTLEDLPDLHYQFICKYHSNKESKTLWDIAAELNVSRQVYYRAMENLTYNSDKLSKDIPNFIADIHIIDTFTAKEKEDFLRQAYNLIIKYDEQENE